MPATRVLLEQPPFLPAPSAGLWERGVWPARWIHPPGTDGAGSALWLARLRVELPSAATVRIHVTADERFDLCLDGERIGRGPERGDPDHWPFVSFDLVLDAGRHVLVARTWHLGPERAPTAQLGVRPGFLLAAEGEHAPRLTTGMAAWEVRTLAGYRPIPGATHDTGVRVEVVVGEVPWDALGGAGDGWQGAVAGRPGIDARLCSWWYRHWRLVPARLPAMREERLAPGVVRHLHAVTPDELALESSAVRSAEHLASEAAGWEGLLAGRALTIPPRTSRRAIIDLGVYQCAYTAVTVAGGAGSRLRVHWTEALWEPELVAKGWPFESRAKGHRDEIEGKLVRGQGDSLVAGGGGPRRVEGLWWSAGRYLEVVVHTADEALVVHGLDLDATGYPWQMTGSFASDDASLAGIEALSVRTLERCTHETFMDCPYYEQMQYIGDTRLQALVGYMLSDDDRLARQALTAFDASRTPDGLTRSRYPARDPQVIPGFSLWWVMMVHDHAHWRDDLAFVRSLMPGVRAVLERFRACRRDDGLVACPEGWNFFDWVPSWDSGQEPGGVVTAGLQFHLLLVLFQVASLEEELGEPALAERHRAWATQLRKRAWEAFWDPASRRLADNQERTRFSEHVPSLALISGALDVHQRALVAASLVEPDGLEPVTVYFSHYLFEAYHDLGRGDLLLRRLDLWRELPARGLTTIIETPEPNRSDCHAWGAHPLFHFRASVLGIRPSSLGFQSVAIAPSLGALRRASALVPHPRGRLWVSLEAASGALTGEIELPSGVGGTLHWRGQQVVLHAGRQRVHIAGA